MNNFTLDSNTYTTCGRCYNIREVKEGTVTHYCPACRKALTNNSKKPIRLTMSERRVVFMKIMQKHLNGYFNNMKETYEIKNKRNITTRNTTLDN